MLSKLALGSFLLGALADPLREFIGDGILIGGAFTMFVTVNGLLFRYGRRAYGWLKEIKEDVKGGSIVSKALATTGWSEQDLIDRMLAGDESRAQVQASAVAITQLAIAHDDHVTLLTAGATRFDDVEGRISSVDARLEGVESKLDALLEHDNTRDRPGLRYGGPEHDTT